MNLVVKENLLKDLNTRLNAIEDLTKRDFTGGMSSYVNAARELKEVIWKVEAGVYDMKVWED